MQKVLCALVGLVGWGVVVAGFIFGPACDLPPLTPTPQDIDLIADLLNRLP